MNMNLKNYLPAIVVGILLGISLVYGKAYFTLISLEAIALFEGWGVIETGASAFTLFVVLELLFVAFLISIFAIPLGFMIADHPSVFGLFTAVVSIIVQSGMQIDAEQPMSSLLLMGFATSLVVLPAVTRVCFRIYRDTQQNGQTNDQGLP